MNNLYLYIYKIYRWCLNNLYLYIYKIYRCKMACLERKNRLHWQSIHRGWEWIRKDLRSRLRAEWERIYVNDTSFSKHHKMVSNTSNLKEKSFAKNEIENETCSELIVINDVTNDKSKKKKLTNIEKSHPNYQAYHTCKESAAYVTAIRSEALELKQSIKQSETLRKTLRKLTNLNWVLCYERFAKSSSSSAFFLHSYFDFDFYFY